jgi:hypothetical protein
METTTFCGIPGTRVRSESPAVHAFAWKQQVPVLRVLGTIPADDNSTGVSATGRRHR